MTRYDVFNGDVGLALSDTPDALMVYFPDKDGGYRAVAPLRLPEHETAFATTVHKAQGSEFDCLLLMLPARPSRVVTRELLYTAVTRSRSRVAIVSPARTWLPTSTSNRSMRPVARGSTLTLARD